jgi:hypothetical protein
MVHGCRPWWMGIMGTMGTTAGDLIGHVAMCAWNSRSPLALHGSLEVRTVGIGCWAAGLLDLTADFFLSVAASPATAPLLSTAPLLGPAGRRAAHPFTSSVFAILPRPAPTPWPVAPRLVPLQLDIQGRAFTMRADPDPDATLCRLLDYVLRAEVCSLFRSIPY